MFIAAEFHNSKNMEPAQMPINQRVDKETMIHTHTYIYDGLLLSHKRNKLTAFSVTCMRLVTIIFSEVTQEWKAKHHMFSLIWELSYEDAKA